MITSRSSAETPWINLGAFCLWQVQAEVKVLLKGRYDDVYDVLSYVDKKGEGEFS